MNSDSLRQFVEVFYWPIFLNAVSYMLKWMYVNYKNIRILVFSKMYFKKLCIHNYIKKSHKEIILLS